MRFTHGEITSMAKEICKINRKLLDAIMYAEQLSHDDDIRAIIRDPESPEFKELQGKVAKYTDYESAADTNLYGSDLDDATEILKTIFEDIDLFNAEQGDDKPCLKVKVRKASL